MKQGEKRELLFLQISENQKHIQTSVLTFHAKVRLTLLFNMFAQYNVNMTLGENIMWMIKNCSKKLRLDQYSRKNDGLIGV